MSANEPATARIAARARALLQAPLAYVEPDGDRYRVRVDEDRRKRPALTFDEAVFRRLAGEGVLAARKPEGWRLARGAEPPAPDCGASPRPGLLESERAVFDPDGRLARRRVNLASSPLGWLSGRRDAAGRPLIGTAEAAAAERLADDQARAGSLGRLTMDWSTAPNPAAGRWNGLDAAERGRFARSRFAAALAAMDPDARTVVEQVCLRHLGLSATEQALGLKARSGRERLLRGLRQLAVHYGLAPAARSGGDG